MYCRNHLLYSSFIELCDAKQKQFPFFYAGHLLNNVKMR